jgi:hypothetical protein
VLSSTALCGAVPSRMPAIIPAAQPEVAALTIYGIDTHQHTLEEAYQIWPGPCGLLNRPGP